MFDAIIRRELLLIFRGAVLSNWDPHYFPLNRRDIDIFPDIKQINKQSLS
jgi:hypothetical protein